MPNRDHIITIFGSARPRPGDPEYDLAYEVGRELALAGFTVCNGGYGGIMEASAKGAKSAGGRTIGVVADYFKTRTANKWIDSVVTVQSMVDRLLELVNRGEGYVVLEGGTGTLLELATVWEFMNKGMLPQKPVVVVGRSWDAVVGSVREKLMREGSPEIAQSVTVVESARECAQLFKQKLLMP